jgi:pimeloyl-ACP methyl ester carboxylesterase
VDKARRSLDAGPLRPRPLKAGAASATSPRIDYRQIADFFKRCFFAAISAGSAAMTIIIARDVGPSRIDLAYERLGDPNAPLVVLLMGLGAQLIAWPDGLCDELLHRNLQLVRLDNRDVGQSTRATGTPDFAAAMRGDTSSAAYTLSDLADDTVGLLDVLGTRSAHLVGASMGAGIAQTIAIEHAERVRSLTSIMWTTGAAGVGQIEPQTAAKLFAGGAPTTREQVIERMVSAARLVGSPGFPLDEEAIADRAGRSFDRGYDPGTALRQGVAVLASGDRTERLRTLRVPTLVIHGDSDKMVDISGGRATAAAIPGAELVEVPGMGHDLPQARWAELADHIAANNARGEAQAARGPTRR